MTSPLGDRMPARQAVHAVDHNASRTVCHTYRADQLEDVGPWGSWPWFTRCQVCHDLVPGG
jgi:hypothetical protein